MHKKTRCLAAFIALLLYASQGFANPYMTRLEVWANEAIIATYSFADSDFISRQKEIARLFTANGWINYSKALLKSKLPDIIKENQYVVSSVATMPPRIKQTSTGWQAVMPILVVYKNPAYQQKQTLLVTIDFVKVPDGKGVRGFAITALHSKVIKPICECKSNSPKNEKS